MGMTSQYKILDDHELETILSSPRLIEDILFPEQDDDPFKGQVSLGKEWHSIHYILCECLETDGSLDSEVVLGGVEIGPDLGYGPARIFKASKVTEIADVLESVKFVELATDVVVEEEVKSQIYGGFNQDRGIIEQQYLLFRQLSKLFGEAAKNNKAVLTYFS